MDGVKILPLSIFFNFDTLKSHWNKKLLLIIFGEREGIGSCTIISVIDFRHFHFCVMFLFIFFSKVTHKFRYLLYPSLHLCARSFLYYFLNLDLLIMDFLRSSLTKLEWFAFIYLGFKGGCHCMKKVVGSGLILACIFLHPDWIRRNTARYRVSLCIQPNAEKCGPE